MRHLFLVLIRALARLFRGCADILAAFGSSAPPSIQGEAVPFSRTPSPPEDWLRRANPPPPAHWLSVVRRRAPGFVQEGGKPSHSVARQAPVLAPAGPLSEPATGTPEAKPDSKLLQRKQVAGPTFPPKLIRPPVPRQTQQPRSVRIVTVVEETPRRPQPRSRFVPAVSEEAEAELPKAAGVEEVVRKESPERSQSLAARPRESILLRNPTEVAVVSEERLEADRPEEPWRPLLDPGPASPILPSVPGSSVLPAEESPEGLLHLPSPEQVFPEPGRDLRGRRESGATPAAVSRWPELPASAESEDLEDARILCRELQRRSVLEDEQRGLAWSA